MLTFFVLSFSSPLSSAAQNDTVRDDKASDFNLNKPARVEWFRNTGTGLFIHFGVDAQLGIVISHSLVGASDDYVDRYFNELPRTFDPSRWDPHAIAVLAKLAGMKYIVFTTKHHSGFCMWDTRTNDFNSMHTPYHKDLLKEFVEATRAEGLGVGFYFSPEDFYFLHEHHLPISRTDVQMDASTRQAYDDYTRRQCEELMTNYGKIDVLFIDGEPKEVVKQTCWRLQPDLLITRGALRTPEQVLPGEKIKDPWLSCITMGTAWQYQPSDERYKSGTQLIQLAIEARAKGGSLLLNVGPRPDGQLPVEQEDRLREIAAWYFINHECMDSVRAWVVPREGDIWFTTREPHTLYAIVTDTKDWMEGERKTFLLHSVKSTIGTKVGSISGTKVDSISGTKVSSISGTKVSSTSGAKVDITSGTKVGVLGQNSRSIEYKSDDVSSRWRQTGEGLEVSVVKAQRIYDDHRWPNPVVIRLENIEPVFREEVQVQTGESQSVTTSTTPTGTTHTTITHSGVTHIGIAHTTVILSGSVTGNQQGQPVRACFYYRPYAGQVETLYAAPWKRTAWVQVHPDANPGSVPGGLPNSASSGDIPPGAFPGGSFHLLTTELDPQRSYEYRAVVEYHGIEINGDDKVFHPSSPKSKITKSSNQKPISPPAVIPLPAQWQSNGATPFIIGSSTVIRYADPSLEKAAEWLNQYQSAYTGKLLTVRYSRSSSEPATGILLAIDTAAVGQPEGYRLQIDKDHITLTGHDPAGVLYGLQTLRQLWQEASAGSGRTTRRASGTHLSVPAYTIEDHPRYAWRGMHLDVSRHLFPVTFIKKFIDLLVLYKFNSFHWHLTDDQGWRIEIPQYPRLQSVAAWRSETLIGHKRTLPHRFDGKRYGGYYTQQQIREIVQYAADRQVTIIPEIEMPGHAMAALAAYPSLGCTGGPYQTATYWGVFDDVYCAGNDSVFVFLENVLDQVMSLFPSSYIHIGGDECPKTRWKSCLKCQRRMQELGLKDEQALQSYFVQRIEKYVNSKGRHIIGWDEILEGGLAPDATVMSWRGEEGGLAAARARHSVIMTPESHLYFDYYQTLYPGGQLAAGGYTPLSKVYAYEPLAASPDKEARSYIRGLQGALWSEYLVTPAQVEYAFLPRAAALSELAWSPPRQSLDAGQYPSPEQHPPSGQHSNAGQGLPPEQHRVSEQHPDSADEQPSSPRGYDDFLRRFQSQERLLHTLHVHFAENFDEITYTATPEDGKIRVSLHTSLPGAVIRYTTDGSLPDNNVKGYSINGPPSSPHGKIYPSDSSLPGHHGKVYSNPVLLERTGTLQARVYLQSKPRGPLFRQSFTIHQAIGARVSIVHPPTARYDPGVQALVNGIMGNPLYNDGQWLGWSGDDLEAVIDLGSIRKIHSVGLNLLNYHWQKMWAPVSLQFFISADGIHFKEIARQQDFPVNGINKVRQAFDPEPARYVKVKAVNRGIIPEGSYGAGSPALLMVDEIIIE